jgi:hypothetical protein
MARILLIAISRQTVKCLSNGHGHVEPAMLLWFNVKPPFAEEVIRADNAGNRVLVQMFFASLHSGKPQYLLAYILGVESSHAIRTDSV